MKKPRVLLDLSIYLEALLSIGSDSSRLLRRWLDDDHYDVLATTRCLRALEGAVLDREFLEATQLDVEAAKRWVAALAVRVETIDVEELGEDVSALESELSQAELSALDRDSIRAARWAHALIISSDPQLLQSKDLGVEILPPASMLGLLDAL